MNKCRDVLTPQEGCCELNNPLYEVFHSSRNILGQHSPGAAAACHPSITENDGGGQAAAAQGWVRAAPSPEGEVFPGLGTPLCPQTQHREVGGRRRSSHAPSGMGTRAHLAQAEGLQVGRGAPEKPSYGTTEGEGQPVPESWHSHPGCQHRPLANAFPRCRAWQEWRSRSGEPASPGGELGTTAGSFLLISSRPAAPASAQHPGIPAPPLPGPSGPAELPASAKPHAEEGNQPWGCPCATHLRGEPERGNDGQEEFLSGSAAPTDLGLCISCPCPSQPVSGADQQHPPPPPPPRRSRVGVFAARLPRQGSAALF